VSHTPPYQLLADVVLSLHFSIVLFVVGGLIFILVGAFRGWRVVRKLWFRLAHLAAIAIIVAQAWLGTVCPLTTLEMWFRAKAHDATYSGSFIEHWLQRLLYYEAQPWVFTLAYTVFGIIVLVAWWYFPPWSKPGARGEDGS
jgi:polyferredoxin